MEDIAGTTVLLELTQSLSNLPGFTTLIKIFQTAGIVFIIYLIFLFVKSIIQYRRLAKISTIVKTLESVNQTLFSIDKKLTSTAKQKLKK